jgi:glycyl-tRNA synthetase beta chain
MADFLFEIGLEEVPARMIAGAEAELLRRTLAMLGKESLLGEKFDPLTDAKSYSTPRRLAVMVRGVRELQSDVSEEVMGPAKKIAFKDGVATPAAEAFAKKNGVSVNELRKVETAKGEYLAATVVKKGRSAAEVIASEMPKELAAIYWAKSMYWRAGKPERFVRPVMWMACLLGEMVVPVEFGGKTAGRASFGHRVLSSGEAFEIQMPESYLAQLEGEYVLADVEARRHKIRKALDKVTRDVAGARWREDEALVDTVTHLTEWPDVVLGDFEAAYLELPEEVLVTVMRDHQKYFAVEDAAGKLAPHFLAVVNVALDAINEPIIKQGNERVLRARFNDAKFFWEFDQRVPLVERDDALMFVTFQKQLGSYYDKQKRMKEIWANLIHRVPESPYPETLPVISGVDEIALSLATQLCKSDLTTELVKEFTELQGVIGGLYAWKQGASETVKDAIYYQYEPRSMSDAIPPTIEGCLLSLSDRLDTIAGMFALGLEPTGSKDPFALRRAANGVIKILAEWPDRLNRSLDFVSKYAVMPYGIEIAYWQAPPKGDVKDSDSLQNVDRVRIPIDPPAVVEKMRSFLIERLEFYLREIKGNAYDTVIAVMNAHLANPNSIFGHEGWSDVSDVSKRAEAVTQKRGSANFLAVCRAFKRLRGIYAKASTQQDFIPSFNPSFSTQVERDLWDDMRSAGAGYLADCTYQRYGDALDKLAKLGPSIDDYFGAVMVMDENPEIRINRLGMVRYLLVTFSQIADFSEIVVG